MADDSISRAAPSLVSTARRVAASGPEPVPAESELVATLAGITDDKTFRRDSLTVDVLGRLPEAARKVFLGKHAYADEPVGLARTHADGSSLYLYPLYGNLTDSMAGVVGVAVGADGRFVPVRGQIQQTWFGRTAELAVSVAGPSFAAGDAAALATALKAAWAEAQKTPRDAKHVER